MYSNEIRSRFLKFFETRGHKIIPSASLVPENDPSVLFNTAGMQPLVPYLLGQKHPMGNRLVDAQKCVRTVDIDEVGDNRHLTFFEMLGNWSLGDYFKEDAIKWSFEFLTSKEEGLGLEKDRLYITVFEGDENAPRDEEAAKIWKKYIPENRIYFLPAKNNWWSAGDNGPCGPDTEIFYDIGENFLGDLSPEQFAKADEEGKVVEIWNNVFMEYEKEGGKVIGKLKQRNVDTGMGLERIVMVSQKKKNVYETDLFNGEKTREERIVADHVKAALFMISDGVIPSNTGAGYVLRRLIRRAVRFSKNPLSGEIEKIKKIYDGVYALDDKGEIEKEENKFRQTLQNGLKEFEKGVDPFVLATTYGFPVELTLELAKEKGQIVDLEEFNRKMAEHQKLSHTSSAGMFKGGLANHNEKTIKLHTAHHLLLAGLQAIVDKNIKQRGSNITEERLRMDFLCDHKLTDEEKKKVEDWVNEKIQEGLNVRRQEMPLSEAEKIGAEMEFGAKYPEIVSVYIIEDKDGNVISKEFCGGPHVSNTKEIGQIKIQKEEAVAKGIRRIKAVIVL
ncbi:MAG: alanine--tRNA ligase [Candidatus Paceibacterota bacterium]|jgi:alanyl-tRNA synthetase